MRLLFLDFAAKGTSCFHRWADILSVFSLSRMLSVSLQQAEALDKKKERWRSEKKAFHRSLGLSMEAEEVHAMTTLQAEIKLKKFLFQHSLYDGSCFL